MTYGPMIEPVSVTPARITDAEREQLRMASCRYAVRAARELGAAESFTVTSYGAPHAAASSTRETLEARRLLCQAPALLDGAPAQICGAAERFAHVSEPGGRAYMYAWGAVVRILERGGRFSS